MTALYRTAVLLLVACSATTVFAAEPTTKPARGPHPRPAVVGVDGLDVFADRAAGRLHLLTVLKPGDGHAALAYQRSDDAGATWTAPVPVGAGQPEPTPSHRGADAQIAAAGDRVVAVWTTPGTIDRFGRGPMASAVSADGGRTWAPGPDPSDSGQATGHAFVDVAADADGTFHCVWLDSRTGDKGLRYARSTDGGRTWSANQTLVGVTCECCWNALATGPGGRVWVLFRQRMPRDMAVVASTDGGKTWGPPVPAARFGWKMEACPHVGGGLALPPEPDGRSLHAVVWTGGGGDGAIGAYVLTSPDLGHTWGEPTLLGDWKGTRPDVATAPRGRVAAVWDARTTEPAGGDGQAVFARTSVDGGKTWTEPRRLSRPEAAATHARVVPAGDGFVVLWTESEQGKTTWRQAAVK
ncbi:MAG TPA: sialidase family protein [Humisphaera sp.]